MHRTRLAGVGLVVVAVAGVVAVRAHDSGPQPWSTPEAAHHFLAMSAPLDRDRARLAALPATATITDWVAVCRSLSTSNAAYLTDLEHGSWDPALRQYVDAVVEGARATQAWYDQCRRTSTMDGLDALGPLSARLPDVNATANLREQLGLSPTG